MHDNEHSSHHEESFIRKYIFSLDHKMIGKQFLIYGLIMLFLGGGLALLFRWQLAYPERPLPIIGASQQYLDEGEVVTGADRMWERIYESEKEEWLEVNMPSGSSSQHFTTCCSRCMPLLWCSSSWSLSWWVPSEIS